MRRLRRILLVIVILILLLAGAATGYVAVTMRKMLPQTDGTLSFAGLDGQVTVYRDAKGIPQIYATTTRDLFFAQGVVHAQDRWWQMEFNRHTGLGRISELTGKNDTALRSDVFIRTLGWNRAAQADVNAAPPETLAVLNDYSDGVNAYIGGKSGSDLAVEYSVLAVKGINIPIEKWSPLDTIAWGKAMSWLLSGNLDNELLRTDLYKTYTRNSDPMQRRWSMTTICHHILTISVKRFSLRKNCKSSRKRPLCCHQWSRRELISAIWQRRWLETLLLTSIRLMASI